MKSRPGWEARGAAAATALWVILFGLAVPGSAQGRPEALEVAGPDGSAVRIPLAYHRGFASLSGDALSVLGWTVFRDGDVARVRSAGGEDLVLRADNPWARWGDRLLQMPDAPYFFRDRVHVSVGLAVDVLPRILPDVYAWDGSPGRLQVLSREYWRPDDDATVVVTGASQPVSRPEAGAPEEPVTRVVVIDPGHGGRDPGSMGRDGLQEKEVALSVALALAERLRREPNVEVRLTRDDDTLVPIWKRGELATEWKGERPGVFISLHANAAPRARSVRGFETYFLSEARTEHERRVAANENAPIALRGDDEALRQDPDLDFILKELRNLDHQHWSALLAEMVQDELQPIHPGPNRGVKQGPLAVITNALMPAVLVELGFVTNPQEARLLRQSGFHRDAADGIARAVVSFFERYPPGADESVGGGR